MVSDVLKISCNSDQFKQLFLLKYHRTDIRPSFLCSTVHANTATLTRYKGSDLVQLVTRGNFFNNFLTVDVSENILDIKIYNEIGEKKKFNAQYIKSGELKIDKTSSITEFSSSGMLELLDLSSQLISFDFETILPLGTRQILGFRGKDSLIVTEATIRGKLCTESIHNIGGFGAQYDAVVGNVGLAEGRNGGQAGNFTSDSRMAIYGRYCAQIKKLNFFCRPDGVDVNLSSVTGTGPFSAGEGKRLL